MNWMGIAVLAVGIAWLLVLVGVIHRGQREAWAKWESTRVNVDPNAGPPTGANLNPSTNLTMIIGADGMPYISKVDTKRLGEEASKARQPRHVKVYHKQPGDTYEDRNKVYYGQNFSAATFHHIELVDPPKGKADQQWIREHLMTRIAPGGKLRLSKEMVPHGKSD